jgi:protein phosphatase
LKKAIETANDVIYRTAEGDPRLEGMGTTVVAATFVGKYLEVLNVGDSRLYVMNDKQIRQITVDHSLVEEMVRRGGIARSEARNHPDKNIITRALGAEERVEIDFFDFELKSGCVMLMCSDGLSNMVEDSRIEEIVHGNNDLEQMGQALLREANQNGGKDNIAIVLIQP